MASMKKSPSKSAESNDPVTQIIEENLITKAEIDPEKLNEARFGDKAFESCGAGNSAELENHFDVVETVVNYDDKENEDSILAFFEDCDPGKPFITFSLNGRFLLRKKADSSRIFFIFQKFFDLANLNILLHF